MNNWLNNSTFLVYAITCLVLCVNLLFLWGYSGAARGKTKTAMQMIGEARAQETLSTASAEIHRFAQAGTYYIRVADYQHSGRAGHFYRIITGEFPLVFLPDHMTFANYAGPATAPGEPF